METKTAYSIGIPEIDAQHKQLFDCIDWLEAAGDDRQRELAVYYVMDELRDSAVGWMPSLASCSIRVASPSTLAVAFASVSTTAGGVPPRLATCTTSVTAS